MSDLDSQPKPAEVTTEEETPKSKYPLINGEKITPFNCFSASAISAVLGYASYLLTKSVIGTYAEIPIDFDNPMAARIASTVRTLIMGLTVLATFLFAMVAVGLVALAIKLIIESKKTNESIRLINFRLIKLYFIKGDSCYNDLILIR